DWGSGIGSRKDHRQDTENPGRDRLPISHPQPPTGKRRGGRYSPSVESSLSGEVRHLHAGGITMAASYTRWSRIGALVAGLLLLAGGAANVRADEKGKEDPLRAELLKLNNAGTEEVQTAKLRAL